MGIGPMGFGGETTVLDVQMDTTNRPPARVSPRPSATCAGRTVVQQNDREGRGGDVHIIGRSDWCRLFQTRRSAR